MSRIVVLGLAFVALILSACGSDGNSVSRVTALPTQEDVGETAVSITSTASPTPTMTPTVVPTESSEEMLTTAPSADTSRSGGTSNFAFITNTPAPNRLEPGEARSIALATDTVMEPEIAERIAFEENPVPLTFSDFYSGFSIRTGLQFSDKLKSLDGERVVIEGYVAPPLKPRLDFFVLTKIQLAFCPFCSSDVEWPDDIALIYLPEQQLISSEYPVRITGMLEVGSSVDAETGMVSLVRVYSEELEILR